MRTRYNQQTTSVLIDGVAIQDFFEGASIVFVVDGGEVDKTHGTDGPAVNLATDQGATCKFTLRETSRSRQFLADLRRRQSNGGSGVTVVLLTGAEVVQTMQGAYLSNPGELSTGDKKMGSIQYTLTSPEYGTENLDIN
jgi:hypothetical protein